jgi:hypothetical protein
MSNDARYMSDQILKHLVGGKITQALTTFEDDAEEDHFGDFAGFVVTKTSGRMERKIHVWVQSDPEGNGGGFLALEDPKTEKPIMN